MLRSFSWKNPRAKPGNHYCPTALEKLANCLTHIPWIPFCIFGTFRLILKARTQSELIVAIVYGLSLVLLFVASSAFHCSCLFSASRTHNRLHVMDRLIIYVFIASSYTPWLSLKKFEMDIGTSTLFIVWASAIFATFYQYNFHGKFQCLELLLYLALGVLPSITIFYMSETSGQLSIFKGGLLYLVGFLFFNMDGRIPLAHAIWHCFVVSGAYTHFMAVDIYLLS